MGFAVAANSGEVNGFINDLRRQDFAQIDDGLFCYFG